MNRKERRAEAARNRVQAVCYCSCCTAEIQSEQTPVRPIHHAPAFEGGIPGFNVDVEVDLNTTTTQEFIDGGRIGGSDDLNRHLAQD